MRFSSTIGLALPLLAAAAPSCQANKPRAAVYILDNNPASADIIAFGIGNDGQLSGGERTATGGKGLDTITNPPLGGPAEHSKTDSTFSSDIIIVRGNYLFTVAPGSNEVAAFWIDPNDVLKPKPIGQPISTGGVFPVSVAYAESIKTACVLNGGTTAGVSCFSFDPRHGLKPVGGLRSIKVNAVPNPPAGPVGTASDLVFNPSESALYAVFKGNDGMQAGFVYVFPVVHGAVSTTPVINRPSAIPVPFSIEFLGSDDSAILTDPTYGISTVKVGSDFTLTEAHKQPVAGQQALCWTAYSAHYDTLFVMDGGAPNVTLINPTTGTISGALGTAQTDLALFDAKYHNQYLYILGGSSVIAVLDVSPTTAGKLPTIHQEYNISSLGKRDGFQGLAIYPQ